MAAPMTDLDTGPSSIRDDSICESSLPPNKSSGDIVELKPCPFCGKPPSCSTASSDEGGVAICFECPDGCSVSKERSSYDDAVAAWNTRASPSSTSEYDDHWTRDAGSALRFARQEDARAYVDHIGWTSPPVRVVEHMWPAPRATLSASPVAQEPVAWLRNLVGAECKPDGRCYDICFADPKDDRYRALYTSPPATPAGVGADEIARLVEDLKAASESLHLPPSIQSQRNIKAMNAMDRAAKIILALLSRAGDQSNSTHEA